MAEWAEALSQRMAMTDYKSPTERLCLLRWVVEFSHFTPLQKRLDAVQELSRVAGYTRYNHAVVLWRSD